MALAIIIVSYQSPQTLAGAVDSAMRQLGDSDQVIVWDNHSADDTEQVLDELQSRWPTLTVYRSDRNLGFAGGNNAAVKLAAHDADLLLLNPDAVLKLGAVQAMRTALQSDKAIGAVGAVQLSMDESTIDGIGDVYHFSGLPWRSGFGQSVSVLAQLGIGDASKSDANKDAKKHIEIFGPCGAAALYRRTAFDAANGFDEDYFCYCEDVDLAFRLRIGGWRSVRADQAVVLHAGSASTGVDSDFSVYHGHRNMIWTFFKNMPAGLLLVFLLPHVAMNLLVMVKYSLRGRASLMWRSRLDALRGMNDVMRKRKSIQSGRRISTLDLWRMMDKSFRRRHLAETSV